MKNNKLFVAIIVALIIGVALGGYVHYNTSPEFIKSFSTNIKLLGTIFIRLIQMIIAPLVFSTLVVGIAKMGDMKMVGRVGGRALGWFLTASLTSLVIGCIVVNIMKPGEGLNIEMDASSAQDLLNLL